MWAAGNDTFASKLSLSIINSDRRSLLESSSTGLHAPLLLPVRLRNPIQRVRNLDPLGRFSRQLLTYSGNLHVHSIQLGKLELRSRQMPGAYLWYIQADKSSFH